jgi:uncharacterized protein (TIGR02611 family)
MKKFFVGLIGGTVLSLGVAMLVLPGPGALVIVAGVAILATEFVWARRVWRKAKGKVARARRKTGLRDWLRRIKARWNKKRPCAELGGERSVR